MARKTILTITFILTFFNGFGYAQTNDIKMQNIAAAGNYFEAKDYHSHLKAWGDTLSSLTNLLYKVNMSVYENRPDSVVYYLEEILKQAQSFGFYHRLCDLYVQLQDYPKAFSACNRARTYLQENPDSICETTLQKWAGYIVDWENRIRQTENKPVIKILRGNTENFLPIIEDKESSLPYNEVIYNNGNKIKTMFDSGTPDFFCIDKEIARQIGVRRYYDDNDTLYTVNGAVVFGYTGILDSVQIANIKLYNLPVNVIDMNALSNTSIGSAQREAFRRHYQTVKILLGIKTINLIGNFVWDFENKILYFPLSENKAENRKKANLFIFENKLYTQIEVNNIPLITLVDTGDSESIKLDSWFYEKNKKDIPIDTSVAEWHFSDVVMIHSIRHNVPRRLVYKPIVTFESKKINSSVQVWVQSLIEEREFDNPDLVEGTIGYQFLKSLGKQIQINLSNMRIDVLK